VKFLSELVEYLCRYGGNIAKILPLKIARQKIIGVIQCEWGIAAQNLHLLAV